MLAEDRPAPRYDLACADGSAGWYCSCKNAHGAAYKPQRFCLDAGRKTVDAVAYVVGADHSCVTVIECHQAGEGTYSEQGGEI